MSDPLRNAEPVRRANAMRHRETVNGSPLRTDYGVVLAHEHLNLDARRSGWTTPLDKGHEHLRDVVMTPDIVPNVVDHRMSIADNVTIGGEVAAAELSALI